MKVCLNSLLIIVLLCLFSGCGSNPKDSTANNSIRPLQLPELYLAEPEVKEQIQAEYDKLTNLIKQPNIDQATLGKAFGHMGQIFLAYDLTEQAEIALSNAAILMPEEFRWPYYLGYLYFTLGRYERALYFWKRSKQIKPKDPIIWVRMAEVLYEMGQIKQAKKLLQKAINKEAYLAYAHALLGQIAYANRDYRQAIKHFEQALKLQPQASSLHYSLGLAYRNLGRNNQDLQKSILHLQKRGPVKVHLEDPYLSEVSRLKTGPRLLSSRASALMIQGQYAEAEKLFEQVVRLDSTDALAFLNLGSVKMKLGKTDEAIAALIRCLQLKSSQSVAHMLLGRIYSQKNEPKMAEKHYRAALRADPQNDEAHFGLASLLRKQSRYEEALLHFKRVLEITPGYYPARVFLAVCYMQDGKYAAARKILQEAYNVYPHLRVIRDALIRVLVASPDKKVRDVRLALKIIKKPFAQSNHPETLEAKAMIYAELGQFDEAIRWQKRAIQSAQSRKRTDYAGYLQKNLRNYQKHLPCRIPWQEFYEAELDSKL
ncbi:MAG: tetratricopeptide repeat protein [Calditrichaeota bacterium]|nr:MAG: tetratricopeptide repeat protein [Calditrichota bacterium]